MNAIHMNKRVAIRASTLAAIFLALVVGQLLAQTNDASTNPFSFVVAGDMRNYVGPLHGGKRQFDGACEAIKQVGSGEFMIVPGDFDPPAPMQSMVDRYLGTNYVCYFVVGNHEVESAANMNWVRHWAQTGIPHLVQRGPAGAEATIYSFDFGNSHFVALSDYFDGRTDTSKKRGISDASMAWLEKDLTATRQPLIWVICHEPLQSVPDMDNGRVRHGDDSLIRDDTRRERFIDLLNRFHVRALLCGHTHDCSVEKIQGIWQVDSGHARGAGDPGAPSTFLKIRVSNERAWVDVYRADPNGEHYQLRKTIELN
jgi:predicted phosphodiesterase